MHSTTILASLLALGLTAAAPAPRDAISYGVSIIANVSPGMNPNGVFKPIPITINQLAVLDGDNGVSLSELIIQPGTAYNVDKKAIECRAYKDAAGVVPGSGVFNVTSPALISTNLATIESILCYIVPVSDA